MELDFSKVGKAIVTMAHYIKEILSELSSEMRGSAATPTGSSGNITFTRLFKWVEWNGTKCTCKALRTFFLSVRSQCLVRKRNPYLKIDNTFI